jgi:hypothetical protein
VAGLVAVILCWVFDLVVVLLTFAWADPDRPSVAATNTAVRIEIRNLETSIMWSRRHSAVR